MKCFSCSKVISKEHAVLFNAMQVCTACDCALSITMGQNRPKKEEVRSFKYTAYIWFLELSGLIVLYAPIFIFYLVLDTLKLVFKKPLSKGVERWVKLKSHHIL